MAQAEGKPTQESGRLSALILLGACVLALALGVRASGPFMTARRMRAENARIKQDVKALAVQNQELQTTWARLQTDAGMEVEARKLDHLAPGEFRLVVPP